tara:strand:- start:661 stop:1218 length:558 start_codon:yes stop_codon:yes gene_type:complete
MDSKKFLSDYFSNFSQLAKPNSKLIEDLINLSKIIIETNKKGKKIMIFGNGGSAAMASHFTVDLTKTNDIRCYNFNEADHITCFANDYGFENWIKKTIEFHGDEDDLLILISSSGNSKNMLNACEAARKKKVNKIITFTGFNNDNPLSKSGDINIWANSSVYNIVENTHQLWLLSLVDLINEQKK